MYGIWRSWFWNMLLCLMFLVMAAIFTGLVFGFKPIAAKLLFGAIAFAMWAGAVRALMLGVVATGEGLKVRALLHTDFIAWRDITEIGVGPVGSGLSNLLGATCPYLRRSRLAASPDELDFEHIELSMLGGYFGDRVAATAQALKERWTTRRQAIWRLHFVRSAFRIENGLGVRIRAAD